MTVKRRIVKMLMLTILALYFLSSNIESKAATFDDINQSSIFVKQNYSDTCTLASAVMLVRRAALMTGNSNWSNITESSMRSTAWLEGTGLYFDFTYAGITVSHGSLNGENQLINLLNEHPEGIVIYNTSIPHAILVTDYTNGTFYCADPANNIASGRIPISSASITINSCSIYWYVSSPDCPLDTDIEVPTISDVYVTNKDATGYTVHCIVRDDTSLSTVKFPTWTENNGQDDITWNETAVSGYSWELNYRVNISDHNNETNCWYYTHIYCYDSAGNLQTNKTISVYLDAEVPQITNVRVTDCTEDGYTVHCNLSDNYKLTRVTAETHLCDQDEMYITTETRDISGTSLEDVTFYVKSSDHNCMEGRYITIITVYDEYGNNTDVWANASVGEKYWKPIATTEYNGHTYELYESGFMRWNTAKTYCDSIGGYLVCINTKEEQSVIEELLEKGSKTAYWIGSTDQYSEGSWTWVTGQKMNYSNWNSWEPNGGEAANYGVINQSNGCWGDAAEKVLDEDGNASFGYICEYGSTNTTVQDSKVTDVTENGYTIEFTATSDASNIQKVTVETFTPDKDGDDDLCSYTFTNINASSANLSYKVDISDHNNEVGRYETKVTAYATDGTQASKIINASIGGRCYTPSSTIIENGHKYELYDVTSESWTSAKTFCESLGGHLITITSSNEQNLMMSLINKGDRDVYWIGCTDENTEGNWRWITNDDFNYTNWNSYEPNGGTSANSGVINKSNGCWGDAAELVVDEEGNGRFGFICEYDTIKNNITYDCKKTVNYNGNKYELYDSSIYNWDYAKDYCESLGGHLVTITSEEEQKVITNILKSGNKERYWLGLSDAKDEGNYTWVTEENFDYSNWSDNEPTGTVDDSATCLIASTGTWNDYYNTNTYGYGFICEYEDCVVSYSVKYELNGGINDSDNPASYTSDDPYLKLKDPSKTNCEFLGWYLSDDADAEKLTDTTKLSGDVTVYAKWKEKTECEINGHKGGTATCTKRAVCSVCGKEYGELDPDNHTGKTEIRNQKAASCSEVGYTGDTYCADCGEKITSGTDIAKKEHTWDGGTVTTKASCTTDGVRTYQCTVCSETKTEAIPATGHTETEICNQKAAQIGVEGYTGDIYCKICGELIEKGKVTEALTEDHEHSYTSTVTKAATCTEKGIMTFTCTCGDSYTEEIPAKGHAQTLVKFEKTATCKTEGYTGDTYCTICGKLLEEGKVTEKKSHTWNDGVITVVPTCTEEGEKTFSCSVCGDTKTEKIAEKGHGETLVRNASEATCTQTGYTGDTYCTVCNIKISSGKEIPKKDHTWNQGTVTKAATETAAGTKQYTCTVCGAVKSEEIAKLPVSVTLPSQAPAGNPISQDKTGMIGQNVDTVNSKLTSTKSDEVKGSVYQLLKLKCRKIGKTSLSVQWSKVSGATSYIVYGAKCGSAFKKLAETKSLNYTQSKLKKGTYYKYVVVAVKNSVTMASSKSIHLATGGGKVGNTKSVKLNKKSVSLKVKKTFNLKVKTTAYSKKLKVKKHRATVFESSNPTIVTVSSKGKITAKKKGTCYVYAYAQDGVSAVVKVKVK